MPAGRVSIDETSAYDSDGEPLPERRLGRVWGAEPSETMQAELSALVFSPHARQRKPQQAPRPDGPQTRADGADGAKDGQSKKARRKRKGKGSKSQRARIAAEGDLQGERATGDAEGEGDHAEDDEDDEDDEEDDEDEDEGEQERGAEGDNSGGPTSHGGKAVREATMSIDDATARVRDALAGQWATIRSVFERTAKRTTERLASMHVGQWESRSFSETIPNARVLPSHMPVPCLCSGVSCSNLARCRPQNGTPTAAARSA